MATKGGSAGAWGGPMTRDPRRQENHSPVLEGKVWNVLDSSLQGRRAAGRWTRPSASRCSGQQGWVPRRCLPGLPMLTVCPAPSSGTGGRTPPAPQRAPSRAQGLSPAPLTISALGVVLLAATLPLNVSPEHPGSPRSGDRCQGTRGQVLTSPGTPRVALSRGQRGSGCLLHGPESRGSEGRGEVSTQDRQLGVVKPLPAPHALAPQAGDTAHPKRPRQPRALGPSQQTLLIAHAPARRQAGPRPSSNAPQAHPEAPTWLHGI